MIRHQLLLIFRSFVRYKSTFFINLIGLSAGLACVLLIYLWASDELAKDKFHIKNDRLFQVMTNDVATGETVTSEGTDALLGETWAHSMPEVEVATVITPPSWFQQFSLTRNGEEVNASGYFAGRDYFKVFTYPLTRGEEKKVLAGKNSIVISEPLAMKLFHTTDCMGKTLEWKWFDLKKEVVVTGLFKGTPSQSTQQFDFLLSFDAWMDIMHAPYELSPSGPFNTFVVLKEGVGVEAFNARIASFIKTEFPKATSSVFVRPYSDSYLYGNYENGRQSGGRITYVKLFGAIALFVLLLACINFMNLFTAKAARRVKEVGVKKVVGAQRRTLEVQYLGESVVMSLIAALLALLLVDLSLQPFNEITGKQLVLRADVSVIVSFLGIALVTGLIAGSYPALYLSGFQPTMLLKGRISTAASALWVRQGLVVFQFVVSIVFIVAVVVVYRQIQFVQIKNLGYQKEHIVYFDMQGTVAQNPDAFLAEVKNIPGVVNATTSQFTPIASYSQARGIRWEGKNEDDQLRFAQMAVNYDMIETLDMKMSAGRSFSREFLSDTTAVIFNESAIKQMELSDPVGKIIKIGGADRTIVGVVKDFHFQSLHEAVKPFFFRLAPRETIVMMVKIDSQHQATTLAQLKGLYKNYTGGLTAECRFLDAAYEAQYSAEQRVATLSRYFAAQAILISCLGLLGLAAFTAERRRKEISIRKVLGAHDWQMVYLLSADFTRIVFVAVVIALPFSYVMAQQWLQGFAYKIELNVWYFAGAGITALAIAWLTVGSQALRAARSNPTRYLQGE